ncbi:MAG: VOC family protein, partial [Gammaproteobacteria bacterium]
MTQPLYTVRQVAYVVRDIDAALKYWVDVLKVGPFFLFEHCPLENQRYRGGPSNADVTLALGNSGDVQIELIYCENDAPSVYKEFLDAGRVGVHHFGMMPENYAETCE